MIDKAQKSVLVLGNGPSLRNLNYAALPIDVDIFRVNQFYFEDFYFAGKEVDLVSCIEITNDFNKYSINS